MSGKTPSSTWTALRIAETDNVAVALVDIDGTARIRAGGETIAVRVAAPIPMGHKFALTAAGAGTEIRKYGAVIGILSKPVELGDHVHIHNLVSLRARAKR